MRLTFLTGCLEPDRDGVGDYTRLLARACVSHGLECDVVALADRFITEPLATDGDVSSLRLPVTMKWAARVEAVRARYGSRPSQCVSLQFVPFSFQRWGIPTALLRALPPLTPAGRLHVMLHEIWIGADGSWRRRLASHAQRRVVLRLCRSAALVHTSNTAYQRALSAAGVAARRLPLFGSIPVASGRDATWLAAALARAGCDPLTRRSDYWVFVMFGTLHPEWNPAPLFDELNAAARSIGKRMVVASVGRLSAGDARWRELEAAYGDRIALVSLGERAVDEIAQLFALADFGIATSPYGLIAKSATATAMLEHGLPVIVSREDGVPIDLDSPDVDHRRLIRRGGDLGARLLAARRAEPQRRIEIVAQQFVAEIQDIAAPAAAAVEHAAR